MDYDREWKHSMARLSKEDILDLFAEKMRKLDKLLPASAAKSNVASEKIPEGCTLVAISTGDGWELDVRDLEGEVVAMLAWPKAFGDEKTTEDLRAMGFEIES